MLTSSARCLAAHAVVGVTLLALALGACGDDDDSTATTASTPAAETTATETAEDTTTTQEDTTTGEASDGEAPIDPVTGNQGEFCRGAESPPNIVNVISYGTDCAAVEAAMSEIRGVTKSFRIGDFQCTRESGSKFSGTWECLGEANFFTFDFAD